MGGTISNVTPSRARVLPATQRAQALEPTGDTRKMTGALSSLRETRSDGLPLSNDTLCTGPKEVACQTSPKGRSTAAGASAVAGTSGLATFVVWLVGRFDITLSAEAGALIAGAVSAATLFIWHTGIRNILQGLWRGQGRFEPRTE